MDRKSNICGEAVIPYIDPIFRFCYHRLSSRYDAEDLASEILCHVLDGLGKYRVESLDAWVWRIARNRYARFIEARKKDRAILSDKELQEIENDYCQIDEDAIEDEFESVFCCLHRLSAEYRNIFVDYYIGEMSVKQLSQKYALPETTVKWRLNVGRTKIREWIGEETMEKVYQRINWKSTGCNGNMVSDRYLHTQIARAICNAAYEKPLTVEEISSCTGIPAMYIEDELPRLIYGDAIKKIGGRYATDFIIFRLENRADMEAMSEAMVKEIADYYEKTLWEREEAVKEVGFYGCQLGMERLGYIFVPYLIRHKIRELKDNKLKLPDGNFPPRKDGGYGWFHIQETEDARELVPDTNNGCCAIGDRDSLYYYWIAKYYDQRVYSDAGLMLLEWLGIAQSSTDGIIAEGMLTEDNILQLLKTNLIRKEGDGYLLNFARFTIGQFREVCRLLCEESEELDQLLCKWILSVRKCFEKFVPKRLDDQINQWVNIYSQTVISVVIEELISRGRLEKPDMEKPFVDGVFCVEGEYIWL